MSMPSTDETTTLAERMAAFWSGISPANEPARIMAGQLAASQAGFARLRGGMAFEEEPAGFEAALQAVKETGL
jgi:hypothetical protein